MPFRVRLPDGVRLDRQDRGHGRVRLDLAAAQQRGVVTAMRGRDGVARLRFVEPFEDLMIEGGELLTVEKTCRLRAALAYFAAAPSTQGDC